MLPKVATTILHSTTRAAAAVQGQSHTLRNVLQLQSSPSSSSKGSSPGANYFNSNWNGGPSSGGRGGRFTHGYLGASRAVTQAQPVVASDTGYIQSDEPEEIIITKRAPLHPPRRLRSQSLSYIPPEHSQKLGVLSTVQVFARSRHAFAQPLTTDDLEVEIIAEPPSPVLTRRNSTASATWNESSVDVPPPPPPPLPSTSFETFAPVEPPVEEELSDHFKMFVQIRDLGDLETAIRSVQQFRAAVDAGIHTPSRPEYNAALEALHKLRMKDQPPTLLIDTYNHMLSRGLVPNYRTYIVLIQALCERDHEVVWALSNLEHREKWRHHTTLPVEHIHTPKQDIQYKEALEKENNFPSAIALFQALISLNDHAFIPFAVFNDLLRACAHYGNIDAAIIIWENFEKRTKLKPSAIMYRYMIQTFGRLGEITAAEDIFNDFKDKCARNLIEWSLYDNDPVGPSRVLVLTWNYMIEAYFKAGMPHMAVSLIDEMMKANEDGSGSQDNVLNGTPSPSPASFTSIIAGFCQSGDLETAKTWFDRLLQQSSPAGHPHDSTTAPTRPEVMAWRVILEAFALKPQVLGQLNGLWIKFLDIGVKDGLWLRKVDQFMVLKANMDRLIAIQTEAQGEALSAQAKKETGDILAYLEKYVFDLENPEIIEKNFYVWKQLFDLGFANTAMQYGLKAFESEAIRGISGNEKTQEIFDRFATLVFDATRADADTFSLQDVLRLHKLRPDYGMLGSQQAAAHLLHSFGLARRAGRPKMSYVEWKIVLTNAAEMEILPLETGSRMFPGYAFSGMISVLEDMAAVLPELRFGYDLRMDIFKAALWNRPFQEVKELFEKFGIASDFATEFEELDQSSVSDGASTWSVAPPENMVDGMRIDSPAVSTAPTSPQAPMQMAVPQVQYESELSSGTPLKKLFMDRILTKRMEEALTKRVLLNPDPRPVYGIVWDMFLRGLRQHRVPAPYTIARLCQALGRSKEIDKVKQVYSAAQILLAGMEGNKKLQSDSWFIIEDGMIIAFAQAGEIDAAHVHRMRILEQGGTPSADAYGGLILHVKDTTDDTSNAMALYQESQMRGVTPNQYLYNNIISKLAKARKADAALELFTQMKSSGIAPSSITYGAVIGACARVGDVVSAEALFKEMTLAKNFKPRIPPYNTMMQLYTTTKPNRERALTFYEEILKAGVKPTEYTYKLLMEAYVIEPIDVERMEDVFEHLCNTPNLEVQGTHFATLINAYGCIAKDLDKALAIYNSIATHPRRPKLDALVFEALTNVFVAHRRMDLIPEYIAQMSAAGVHITAYVVNLMIKGYAAVGDIDKARELFESLVDPAEGVAALHNHAPHEPSKSPGVDPMEPVYREPSTWEAMVRAELGVGYRDRAVTLLERLKTRQYPEAVFNRISGIMVDHSQLLPTS